MPRNPGGAPLPFAGGGVYQPNTTIAEMILRAGQENARNQMIGGQMLGQNIANLGQVIGGGIQDYQHSQAQQKEQARLKAQDDAFMARIQEPRPLDPKEVLAIYGPERGMKIAQGLEAFNELSTKRGAEAAKALPGVIRGMDALSEPMRAQFYAGVREKALATGFFPPEAVPEQYDPEKWKEISAFGKQLGDGIAAKTREVKTRNPDNSETIQIVEDKPGQTFTSAAEPVRAPQFQHVETAAGIQPFDPTKGTLGPVIAPGKPNAPVVEPLVAIVGPDGKPVLVPRSQALGKTPASGADKAPVPGKLTKDERQQFASINYVLPKLDSFSEYVQANPDKYGKWDSFVTNLKQQVPGLASGDYATKAAFIGRMNAEIRHALFGSALTEGEKESAKSFMISETDQIPVILGKIADAKARMQNDIDYYGSQGYRVGAPSESGPGKSRLKFNPQTMALE